MYVGFGRPVGVTALDSLSLISDSLSETMAGEVEASI